MSDRKFVAALNDLLDRSVRSMSAFRAILNPIHYANDMSIRLAEANRAIQAALAKAHNLAINISVTVCDADGRLVAFQRMDGTLAEAHRASYGKALVSATSGRPSGDESIEFSEDFKDFR